MNMSSCVIMQMKTNANIVAMTLLVLAVSPVLHADEIHLRTSVRLNSDAKNVTLANVAELQGPEAMRFADLEVAAISAESKAVEVAIKDIRSKLEQAGVNWGIVNLSGRTVTIRPSRDGNAHPPL